MIDVSLSQAAVLHLRDAIQTTTLAAEQVMATNREDAGPLVERLYRARVEMLEVVNALKDGAP